jgi:hypothetical protein
MNDYTTIIPYNSNISWYDDNDGPSLHTRIGFASAWIFIAVVGIIGKIEIFILFLFDRFLFN